MIGQIISNYEVKSLLGAGGMANVYLAQHQSLGNNVAIKLLKDEFVQHPNIRKRFLAEARNLAKMHHPNVIKVTDLIDAGDIVAFVMEHVAGDSLEDYISKNAPLPNDVIKNLFHQMIDAIEYVHSQGLIHRDIKPSNFMVTQEGSIKLLDFGIAKNLNDGAVDYTKTSMAQQMGTPMYMSPEQVRNTAEITEKSDVYSLGVVLWQMVMNKKPYNSEVLTLPEIQVAIMKDPLPLTNTDWDKIIQQATKKDPLNRILKINFKVEMASTSFSNTVIEKPIREIRKKGPNAKRMYVLIGILIIFLMSALIYNLNQEEKAKNQFDSFPEDTTTETSLPTEKAEEPDLKKEESKKLPDEKTTNQNPPEVIKEEPIVTSTKLKIGQKYQGGIIFYLDNSGKHGKVCTEKDLGRLDWDSAMEVCQNLNLDGYSNWYLPTLNDLELLLYKHSNVMPRRIFGYWSSTEYSPSRAYSCMFYDSYTVKDYDKSNACPVLGVRAF
jgi:serine/threonine-protein kinase